MVFYHQIMHLLPLVATLKLANAIKNKKPKKHHGILSPNCAAVCLATLKLAKTIKTIKT